MPSQNSPYLLSEHSHNEDSFVVANPNQSLGQDFALVQSLDIIAPLGNDPRLFGQTAAANALSDIYAMGGQAYTAMNILSFPSCDMPSEVIQEILLGALDKIQEANAISCGGHTLESQELRFGLSVTGIVNKNHFAQNKCLEKGDILVLTKPLGTGILTTGIRGKWNNWEKAEKELFSYTTKLNKLGAEIIQDFQLKAGTDITGFGLLGHLLEMAKASQKSIHLAFNALPFMEFVRDYAQNGLIPKRCYDNFNFTKQAVFYDEKLSSLETLLCNDPQTSGGLILACKEKELPAIQERLQNNGESAFVIGTVDDLTVHKQQENNAYFLYVQ